MTKRQFHQDIDNCYETKDCFSWSDLSRQSKNMLIKSYMHDVKTDISELIIDDIDVPSLLIACLRTVESEETLGIEIMDRLEEIVEKKFDDYMADKELVAFIEGVSMLSDNVDYFDHFDAISNDRQALAKECNK